MLRIKKFERENENIFYSTDKGFDPNNLLRITVKINLTKVISTQNGIHTIWIYKKESDCLEQVEINNIEAFWILEDIKELSKNDLSQFTRIVLESVEYY